MSRTRPSRFQQVQLEAGCQFCHARAGEWCTTSGGNFSPYLHAPRYWYAQHWYAQERTHDTDTGAVTDLGEGPRPTTM